MTPELSAAARASRVFRATLDALCFAYYSERITEEVLAECLGLDQLGARQIYQAWSRDRYEETAARWKKIAGNFKMGEYS